MSKTFWILVFTCFFLPACNGGEDDIDPTPNQNHQSALASNSFFKTVAYDDDVYVGRRGTNYNFAAIKSIRKSTVKDGKPRFLMTYEYRYTNGATFQTISDGNSDEVECDFSTITSTSQLDDVNGVSSNLPPNLVSYNKYGAFHRINNFIDFEGDFYAWSKYWDEAFNSWRAKDEAYAIEKEDNQLYGWFNEIPLNDFPVQTEAYVSSVRLQSVGSVDLFNQGNQLTIATIGMFWEETNSLNRRRYTVALKSFDANGDSLESAIPLPYNENLDNFDLMTNSVSVLDNRLYCSFYNRETKKLIFAHGDFQGNFKFSEPSGSPGEIIDIIKGERSVYFLATAYLGSATLFKLSSTSELEALPELDRIPTSVTEYKGEIILTKDHLEGGELVGKGIFRLTSEGLEAIGPVPITDRVTSDVHVVSDGNILWGAVENCISPVYKGGAGNQFCGWEFFRLTE